MSITSTGLERPKSFSLAQTIADSPFVRFGHTGLDTVMKMRRVLNSIDPCFGLIYNKEARNFSITNSASFSRDFFQAVFAKTQYSLWQPKVSHTFDQDGNRVVSLYPGITFEYIASLLTEFPWK
jgi:hypothetical protein